ncbi:MAG: hypothetical protein AAFQ22_06490 [Pseudomonadota bacterium]
MRSAVALIALGIGLSQSAQACVCVPPSEAIAEEEFASADMVFKGYILELEYGELAECRVGEGPERTRYPLGKLKVVEPAKGIEPGSIITAKLRGFAPVQTTLNCDVISIGGSCEFVGHGVIVTDPRFNADDPIDFNELNPQWASELGGMLEDQFHYRWFALSLVDGELVSSHECGVFGQIGYSPDVIEAFLEKQDNP